MTAPGDDAGRHVEEAFAPKELRQGLVLVDAPAMQVAVRFGEAAHPLGAGDAVDPEFDVGEGFAEADRGRGEHGLGPGRGGGDADDAGAPGAGGVHGWSAPLRVDKIRLRF